MTVELYSKLNSEYYQKNKTWHVADSPFKARQVVKMLQQNSLKPKSIVEIGCGAGEILNQLYSLLNDNSISFEGYDIAPDAFELSKERIKDRLTFFNEDLLAKKNIFFDLCLVMDVFEHVPDYIGFITQCGKKASYKIYHIPLDMHVSAVLRNKLIDARNSVGHLHYFTKETALATLTETGQEIVDYFYTDGTEQSMDGHIRTKIANVFRKLLFKISPDFAVRLIGGYSLLVLTK